MKLQGNENFNAVAYLQSAVVAEVLDYVNRVANINIGDAGKFMAFFELIETEMVSIATNRKYQVLNTNVIRAIHKRVLDNESVRTFYMELTTSLQVRCSLELGEGELNKLLAKMVKGIEEAVLRPNSDPQSLIPQHASEKQLASQLIVTDQAKQYLVVNTWYFGTILCNFFAATILDQLRLLKSKLTTAPNKANT